jgi:coproporphyrinogen III oxidase-like Fe-S oxidoreductase
LYTILNIGAISIIIIKTLSLLKDFNNLDRISLYKLSLKKNLRYNKLSNNIKEDALLFTIIIIIIT